MGGGEAGRGRGVGIREEDMELAEWEGKRI